MDDFKSGYDAGWVAAIQEAERRCANVWWPEGPAGIAVPWTELVQIRQLVELAKKGQDS